MATKRVTSVGGGSVSSKTRKNREAGAPVKLRSLPASARAVALRFYVVSKGRPSNVPGMHALLAGDGGANAVAAREVTWVVSSESDAKLYAQAGAARTLVAPAGLCASRNAALEDAFAQGAWCVQLSDDITRVSVSADARRAPSLSEANRRSGAEGKPARVPPAYGARALVAAMQADGTSSSSATSWSSAPAARRASTRRCG
jgi:hypothetical protein